MVVAFEMFVGLWASWVALGRTCKVSGEFLSRFSAFLNIFNVFPMLFLFLCSQMVGYCRIWQDYKDIEETLDMLGYARIR